MTDDPITRMRKRDEAAIRRHADARTTAVRDRQDRAEETASPDARKAREVVKALASHTLPELCLCIAKVVGEQALKHRLQDAFDRFSVANRDYMREELRPEDSIVQWLGPHHGNMPEMPPGTPEHKVELAAAWNDMLHAVNEATKVGVQKMSRHVPITLLADIDSDKLILPATTWN